MGLQPVRCVYRDAGRVMGCGDLAGGCKSPANVNNKGSSAIQQACRLTSGAATVVSPWLQATRRTSALLTPSPSTVSKA